MEGEFTDGKRSGVTRQCEDNGTETLTYFDSTIEGNIKIFKKEHLYPNH